MRCKECNIDLAENYKLCPLCGKEAVNEEARLGGIKAAPYSKSEPVRETDIPKAKKNFSFEKLKAVFNL